MESDYCSSVYAWFEQCGVISNIRTHLRQNLVNALKNKDMTLNKANVGPKSAKQYVYDLLIAEYLWNHDYAYTLSVFASEAPMLVNFRQHISQSGDNNDDDDGNSKNKLETDYVWHTLETLGIKPDGPSGQFIINEYANNDMPLLLSVLKYISQLQGNCEAEKFYNKRRSTQNCETQTDYFRQSFSTESTKIMLMRKKLLREKETYKIQLKEKEEELNKRANIIENQMTILNEKLIQAKSLMHTVNEQKRQLIQDREADTREIYKKKLELSVKENSLICEAKRLETEKDSNQILETNLKQFQQELNEIQRDIPANTNNYRVQTREISTQTQSTESFIHKLVIDDEKQELQSLVKQQQLRIEELTLRAVRLSRQLEEAQFVKCSSIDMRRPSIHLPKMQTVLSESSSTDDIIQDAKQRLKRLEEESFKADQCYINCVTSSSL